MGVTRLLFQGYAGTCSVWSCWYRSRVAEQAVANPLAKQAAGRHFPIVGSMCYTLHNLQSPNCTDKSFEVGMLPAKKSACADSGISDKSTHVYYSVKPREALSGQSSSRNEVVIWQQHWSQTSVTDKRTSTQQGVQRDCFNHTLQSDAVDIAWTLARYVPKELTSYARHQVVSSLSCRPFSKFAWQEPSAGCSRACVEHRRPSTSSSSRFRFVLCMYALPLSA